MVMGYLVGNYIYATVYGIISVVSQYLTFWVILSFESTIVLFLIFSIPPALLGAYIKRRIPRKDRKIEKETKQEAVEGGRMKKFQEIISVSDRLSVQRIAEVLEMSSKDIWKRVFDWAKQFNFRIDGEDLVFNKETVNEFIASLDTEFRKWGKDGKV
jgi:hypothetical protein